jgi:hypothetical protein
MTFSFSEAQENIACEQTDPWFPRSRACLPMAAEFDRLAIQCFRETKNID